MKQAVVVLAGLSLLLGGCSGKSEEAQPAPSASASANAPAKVNPWAKNAAPAAAPESAKTGAAAQAAASAQPKYNPWARGAHPPKPSAQPAGDAPGAE